MTTNLPASAQAPAATATSAAPARPGRAKRPPRPAPPRRRRAPYSGDASPDAHVAQLRIRIGSPASLLAVVPGLLGFEPGNSIVVVGTESPGAAVRLTLRYDVPDPRRPAVAAALAAHAVGVLAAQGVSTAVAVGYGSDTAVSPVAAALRERAAESGITLTEVLRAEGQRYWSYVCTEPSCCPPEGTPYDVAGHPAARALAAAGGQLGAAMRRATSRAHAQVARCATRLDQAGLRVTAARLTAVLGQVAVRDAISRYRDGEQVGAEHAAWLTVALRQLRVRDDAWARMEPEHRSAHLRLWTDLTRLARPGYVAAPAALLAFVAWQSGDGALANVALDRSLADNPGYSMALLLRDALDSGAPPAMARLPMTPEEVAAAYDAADAASR